MVTVQWSFLAATNPVMMVNDCWPAVILRAGLGTAYEPVREFAFATIYPGLFLLWVCFFLVFFSDLIYNFKSDIGFDLYIDRWAKFMYQVWSPVLFPSNLQKICQNQIPKRLVQLNSVKQNKRNWKKIFVNITFVKKTWALG